MRVKQLLVLVLLPLLALSTVAVRAANMPQLAGVSVAAEGASTTVTLRVSGAFVHNEYRPNENLLLVDLAGVSAGKLDQWTRSVDAPGVKSYRVVGYSGAGGTQIVRLELTLADHTEVQISDVTNALIIKVASAKTAAESAATTPVTPVTASAPEPPAAVSKPVPPAPSDSVKTAAEPTAQAQQSLPVAASAEQRYAGSLVQVHSVAVVPTADGLSVEVTGSGPMNGTVQSLTRPERVVLDIANSVPSSHAHSIKVGQGGIRGVRIGLFQSNPPVTRIVVDLASPHDFQLIGMGSKLTLSPLLNSSAKARVAEQNKTQAVVGGNTPAIRSNEPAVEVTKPAAATTAAPANAPALKMVKATADTSGYNRSQTQPAQDVVVVEPKVREQIGNAPEPELVNQSTPVQVAASVPVPAPASSTQPADQLSVAQVPAAPPAQPQIAVMMPAAAPQAAPSAGSSAAGAPSAVAPSPAAQSAGASSAGKPAATSTVPVQPAVNFAAEQRQASAQPALNAGPRYTGEPISVNLKDVDLKDFFRLIHEISGLNIVLDPSVSGSLTLVLDNVPWDQALDIVLKNNGLDRQLEGNVLRIATMETLRREAEARHRQVEAQALAVDRVTVTRFLSYAHAKDVLQTIKKQLSSRGDIVSDDRTNALIINDIPSVMPQIDRLLTQLDRKTQEVEIEARVVAATRSFARDIGTQLGFGWGNGTTALGGANAVGTSPNTVGYLAPPPYFVSPSVPLPTGTTPTATAAAVPLFSNLPALSPTSGLSFLNISSNFRVDAIITAAESRGLLKILSRPRVITQNNIQAVVKQGQRVPITTLGQLGGPPTVAYIEAVLRLTVTPQITAENTIFLNVDIENTTPDFSHQVQGNPVFLTQQTTTQVLVTNGGTVVIGGVLQTNNSLNVQQVPLIGSVPGLGNLFKRRSVTTSTQELIFFLTPRIVET